MIDTNFLEAEFQKLGMADLEVSFAELRTTASIPLNGEVNSFLTPAIRQSEYPNVQPRRLAVLLDKLARHASTSRSRADQERAEKRKMEAQAVARLA